MMNASTNIDSITQIEELLAQGLPPDYRDWLLDPESRNPVPARTMVQAETPCVESVSELYPAHEVLRYVDMEKDMIAVDSGDFPPGMIAIGENGIGDYVLLSLSSSDYGSVHFLFHEESNPDDKLWGVYRLGNSFSEWLLSLTPDIDASPVNEPSVPIPELRVAKIAAAPATPWWRFW